ncbi:MAG TPA: TIGR03118 family protein [Thermopolyspora sp.]|jgi:TIGR03118 family protein
MRPRIVTLCATALALGITGTIPAHAAAERPSTITRYDEIALVSDISGKAPVTDTKLVNPWGIAIGKTLWVANAGTGTATVYTGGSGTIKKQSTTVWVPGGTPTGQVVNTTDDFIVKGKGGKGPATFIFSSPSGAITGWNAKADPNNAIISAFTRNADYKGLALMETNKGNFLLGADFAHNRINVWDRDFHPVSLARRAFRDPYLPRNYSAYNVKIVGDAVVVVFALRDHKTGKVVPGKGRGFVSAFTPSGRFVRRLVSRGRLNAPWAVTIAPKGFGSYAGALLIGNFGDGWINAYNPRDGRYLGALRTAKGRPIAIDGLWDLAPGTKENGGEGTLWFSAGIQRVQHGLLGLIRPAGGSASTARPSNTGKSGGTSTARPSNTGNSGGSSGYGY